MIHTLLVFKDEAFRKKIEQALHHYYHDRVGIETRSTLQDAIEYLELHKKRYDLVIFEQRSPSTTMAKILLPLCSGAKFIIGSEHTIELESLGEGYILEQVSLTDLDVEIPKLIKKFEVRGCLLPASGFAEEFISVKAEVMASYCPLNYNVYIKMFDGRFVKIFNKGDPVVRADFEKHRQEKGIEYFYFNKVEYEEVLKDAEKRIQEISDQEPMPEDLAFQEAVHSHAVVRDLVGQMGFTPQAQNIARSAVAMTAKLIAKKPKLSVILTDLKKKEGTYVSSHSISLGTLACAIAYKMDWHSASTYFKLSLAAFMHDITLNDEQAMVNTLAELNSDRLAHEEMNKVKLHPVHAADYVRKLNEIPADVDQIVFQHHERPDGSGFPRGLTAKFISPLSSVFIVAHQLLDFLGKNENGTLERFLRENEELYRSGTFRKIWVALSAE